MKPLYTPSEFSKAKSKDLLKCKCYQCDSEFLKPKSEIQRAINPNSHNTNKYCSLNCSSLAQQKPKVDVVCLNCSQTFKRFMSDSNRSDKQFCSHSCHAHYSNTHKTHGYRRSKLEKWLQDELTTLHPKLEIHYNKKSVINSELDIYIPTLNLAFELNGIFHYEPIYGIDKLQQIQTNDISKSKACHDAKIDLCVIDTSGQTYVKPSTSQKFLDIINTIIKERLSII